MVGAALGAVSNLVGGIMSNKTNMKINQMNNEFNERMLDKQLAFQQDMFDQTNEYNSAVNQRKRLEEAGLNPYLMMSGGNAGTATAMSGGSASAANPIPMQNLGASMTQGASAVGNMVANSVGSTAEAKKNNALAAGQIIDNDFKVAQNMASLGEVYERTRNFKSLADLNSVRYQFEMNNFDNALEQSKANLALTRSQTDLAQAQTAMSWLQGQEQYLKNQYLPVEQMTNFVSSMYNIANTRALTVKYVADAYKANCEAQGINIKNDIAEQTARLIIQRVNSDNYEQWRYNKQFGGTMRGAYDSKFAGQRSDINDVIPGYYRSGTYRNYMGGSADVGNTILHGIDQFYPYDGELRQGTTIVDLDKDGNPGRTRKIEKTTKKVPRRRR